METAFEHYVPKTFNTPEQLPKDETERQEWLKQNKEFWENNPMRYDWKDGIAGDEFSKPFYDEIDKRFFDSVWAYMPWKKIPFDELLPFDTIKNKVVLEVGVGNGSHAQLIATHCNNYTGIDLTEYAINSTTNRFKVNGLQGRIKQMNAEELSFNDKEFDFVWSWGVIHHTADTSRVIKQLHRVLKPGGKLTVMVYYRGWFNYYFIGGFIHGILRGEFLKTKSIHRIIQNHTDGAIARYYTVDTWQDLVKDHFRIDNEFVTGVKAENFPLPGGKFKNALMAIVPDFITRFMSRNLRMGTFLNIEMTKI
jgi:ubiquinone/menaquinone biosynthesis C-methylase UbiE